MCVCAGARARAGVLLVSTLCVCVCARARATAGVLLVSTLCVCVCVCVLGPVLWLEYC